MGGIFTGQGEDSRRTLRPARAARCGVSGRCSAEKRLLRLRPLPGAGSPRAAAKGGPVVLGLTSIGWPSTSDRAVSCSDKCGKHVASATSRLCWHALLTCNSSGTAQLLCMHVVMLGHSSPCKIPWSRQSQRQIGQKADKDLGWSGNWEGLGGVGGLPLRAALRGGGHRQLSRVPTALPHLPRWACAPTVPSHHLNFIFSTQEPLRDQLSQ